MQKKASEIKTEGSSRYCQHGITKSLSRLAVKFNDGVLV